MEFVRSSGPSVQWLVWAVHVGRGEIVWQDRCDAANGSSEPKEDMALRQQATVSSHLTFIESRCLRRRKAYSDTPQFIALQTLSDGVAKDWPSQNWYYFVGETGSELLLPRPLLTR